MTLVGQVHIASACDLWSSEQPQNMFFAINWPLYSLFWVLLTASETEEKLYQFLHIITWKMILLKICPVVISKEVILKDLIFKLCFESHWKTWAVTKKLFATQIC